MTAGLETILPHHYLCYRDGCYVGYFLKKSPRAAILDLNLSTPDPLLAQQHRL